MPLTHYILLFFLLLALALGYVLLARRLGIVDRPLERSSHRHTTVRGGGIVFPVAALIWFFIVGWESPWAMAGLLLASLISFADDLRGLPGGLRMGVHLLAVGLLFQEMGLYDMYWYWIACAQILAIGWINAFNFMDGINGITALYSLVLLGSFSLLNNAGRLLSPVFPGVVAGEWTTFFPAGLVGTVFVAVLAFSFLNFRPRALAFAGDVGSIGLAFLLSWLMIELMVYTHQVWWILFFAVYGIDAVITILLRLLRGDNIFRPHRLHLYQLLANEKGWPHLAVALAYATTQLAVNLLTICLVFSGRMDWAVFILLGAGLAALYLLIRQQVAPVGFRTA